MENKNGGETGISFVVMPIEILQNSNLTSSEKILYCYLSLFKKGVCFQSNDKLAEMTGLDDSTVKRGLRKLSELQYVFIEFVNNNPAARRIYVVMDNPNKLAYLSRKGLFNIKQIEKNDTIEDNKPIMKIDEEKVVVEDKPLKRANYENEEDFIKALYKRNTIVV